METRIQVAIDKANRASQLAEKGLIEEAVVIFEEVIDECPEMVGARCNLSALLDKLGRNDQAIHVLKEAIRISPDFAEAWNNLGNALLHSTRTQAAYEAYSKAIELKEDYFEAHSNRFMSTLYRLNQDSQIESARKEWQRVLDAKLSPLGAFSANNRGSKQQLRLGFLSPDLREHSVAYFLYPILEAWLGKGVEIYLYSDWLHADAFTLKFKSLATHFDLVAGVEDQELLEQIRSHELDVLFDLCGHFSHNRQYVFSQRAAPCQVAWLGYPTSTFTPNIDYRLSDKVICFKQQSAEKILYIESGLHCYQPAEEAPSILKLPMLATNTFTFGCFNNAFKISPEIARVWGLILTRIPNSRLLLKAKAFSNQVVRNQVTRWVSADPEIQKKIHYLERTPDLVDHLNTYNSVDLALDTYPYNGTTTTCESLWMGVPTLTLKGSFEQSRVGASLLHQAQLPAFITDSVEQYIARACAIAASIDTLGNYRNSLRSHLRHTSLMQPASMVEELDQKLREVIGKESGATN